ncbi:hypothetical protein BH11PSE3_BH11PSE3_06380 [soil metagenome]
MAVEDHPKFTAWRQTLDQLIEAKKRLDRAAESADGTIGAAKLDLENAKKAYWAIADEI